MQPCHRLYAMLLLWDWYKNIAMRMMVTRFGKTSGAVGATCWITGIQLMNNICTGPVDIRNIRLVVFEQFQLMQAFVYEVMRCWYKSFLGWLWSINFSFVQFQLNLRITSCFQTHFMYTAHDFLDLFNAQMVKLSDLASMVLWRVYGILQEQRGNSFEIHFTVTSHFKVEWIWIWTIHQNLSQIFGVALFKQNHSKCGIFIICLASW